MKGHKGRLRKLLIPVLALTVFFAFACTAYGASSKTIKPSGKRDNTDIKRITQALKKYKTVRLQKGKKYYLATPIHMRSNRTIIATGATVTAKNDIVTADLKKGNYSNVKNAVIKGGTWKSTSKNGFSHTSIRFVHSSGITLSNMKIMHAGYDGHAVELIACKDVVLDKLTIIPQGKAGKSQESMIQIDIATKATYPRFSKKPSLANGATCHNVTVSNCNIKGNRAIATGYDYKNEGYRDNAHTNILLRNNVLTAAGAEGVFLANTLDATVTDNTIVSNYGKLSSDKAIGLHYLVIGDISGTTLNCDKNTIKGGKYGVRVYSQGPKNVANATLTGNACYSKTNAAMAIQAADKGIDNLVMSGNSTGTW